MNSILLWSGYWLVIYIILDFVLEKKHPKLNINLGYQQQLFTVSSKMRKYKEKLPSISRFDKTKIKSKKVNYLEEYNRELSKAFLMHTLPFLALLPLVTLNFWILGLNTLFCLIFNLPFLLIIYYNKIRIQRVLKLTKNRS